MKRKNMWVKFGSFVLIGLIIGVFAPILFPHNMESMRDKFIDLKEDIRYDQMMNGKYKCCLEKPCTYCIEKTPGHGEGASCNCLADIMNGRHPCGECIGEILEGHGNPLLSEYFATAIANETGHIDAIKEIISEKYDLPVEDQL